MGWLSAWPGDGARTPAATAPYPTVSPVAMPRERSVVWRASSSAGFFCRPSTPGTGHERTNVFVHRRRHQLVAAVLGGPLRSAPSAPALANLARDTPPRVDGPVRLVAHA